jgi:hypothetical protein
MRARSVASGVALVGAAALLLGGCSALPAGLISPTPSGSASPSASAGPIGAAFGDVAPRESITDDRGTYLHVTLSPSSPLATEVDPAILGDLIAGSSWDDAALLDAQRFVATFVAEQTIDSSALDRDLGGWEGWLAETAPTYFGEDAADVIGKPSGGTDRPTPIFNDPNDTTPLLIRDGLARLDDALISITELQNQAREGGDRLIVVGNADVSYRLSDEEAIVFLLDQGYDESAVEDFTQLYDDEDGHLLTHLEFTYVVERSGDGWLIRSYELVSDSNIEGVSQA